MADVTRMAALKICYPMFFFVDMKADNFPLHISIFMDAFNMQWLAGPLSERAVSLGASLTRQIAWIL